MASVAGTKTQANCPPFWAVPRVQKKPTSGPIYLRFQNTNFGETEKRLPPSFGSAAAPDFLPPPPRQRGVVVVLQSRFRCRIRREASSLQGLYKLGRRKWKQQPTLKSSYEAKGRGSNYPQRGWAWGEPKRWGRLRIAIQRSSGASISDSAKLAGSSDVQRRCPSQEERRKPG